jgi:peptidoglycan/LPS O-acetylase OafA/YrhL
MTTREALNRGNNLLTIGITSVIGLTLSLHVIFEDDPIDKLDDGVAALVGAGALVWYLWGRNRTKRSWIPFGLLALLWVLQVVTAFVTEAGDQVAAGDDRLLFQVLFLALIFNGIVLFRTRGVEPKAPPVTAPDEERAQVGAG